MGYHRAGFEIVGVDLRPIDSYPFNFIQGNALAPPLNLSDFDVIHASPPCQPHSAMTNMTNASTEVDLLPQTRELLKNSGKPYIIENVPRAPMEEWFTLCGSMFGLGVQRHRAFETNVFMWGPPRCQHGREIRCYVGRTSSPGGNMNSKAKVASGMKQLKRGTVAEGISDMGIDWMDWHDLCEAIPPAYTEYIGLQLMAYLENGKTAENMQGREL